VIILLKIAIHPPETHLSLHSHLSRISAAKSRNHSKIRKKKGEKRGQSG